MPKPVPLEVPKPANAVISTGFGCAAEDCKSSIPRSESGWRLHLKHYGKCSNRDYLVTFGAFFISEVQKPVRRKPPITAEIRCAKVPFWHKTVPKLCQSCATFVCRNEQRDGGSSFPRLFFIPQSIRFFLFGVYLWVPLPESALPLPGLLPLLFGRVLCRCQHFSPPPISLTIFEMSMSSLPVPGEQSM